MEAPGRFVWGRVRPGGVFWAGVYLGARWTVVGAAKAGKKLSERARSRLLPSDDVLQ